MLRIGGSVDVDVVPVVDHRAALQAFVRQGRHRRPWYRKFVTKELLCSERAKPFYPYIGFLLYMFVGSAILYAVEISFQMTFNFRRSKRLKDCIGGRTYWAAFIYVISATSTIGPKMIITQTQQRGSVRRKRKQELRERRARRRDYREKSFSATPSPDVEYLVETVSIESAKPRFFGRCTHIIHNHPTATVYTIILIYMLSGSLLLLMVERYIHPTLDFPRPNIMDRCLSTKGFWSALFFMVAASSTIGFGNVYPCTDVGRAISTVYSIVGVPMVVYILSNFGRHLCILVSNIYPKIRLRVKTVRDKARRRSKSKVRSDYSLHRRESPAEFVAPDPLVDTDNNNAEGDNDEKDIEIPTSIGIFLTLFCVAMIGVYQYAYEAYSAKDSVYYAFMTFLGGDFVTEKFEFVLPVYFTIFLGFSMLSLTIAIFQTNLERFIGRLKERLMENVAAKIAAAKAASEDPSQINVNDAVDEALNNTKAPWWMKSMIPKKELDLLKDSVTSAINKKDLAVQASISWARRIYQTAEAEAQCEKPQKTFYQTQTDPPQSVEVSTEIRETANQECQHEKVQCAEVNLTARPSQADAAGQCGVAKVDAWNDATVRANAYDASTTTRGPYKETCSMTEWEPGPGIGVQVMMQRPSTNFVMSPLVVSPSAVRKVSTSSASSPGRKTSTVSTTSIRRLSGASSRAS